MEEQPIRAKTIIEIMGAPEEHVKETLDNVVKKAKELKEITILEENVFDTQKVEEKNLWSAFAEIDIQPKDLQTLINFCFDFMPSSIEILKPEHMKLKAENVNNLFNDLLARLHQYDMLLKNMHAQNILLKKEVEKKE